MSAVTVKVLETAMLAVLDTSDRAPSEVRRKTEAALVDVWSKAPALVRIGAVMRMVRRYW